MNLIEVIFLGLALGIDCCVVSFSQGLIFTSNRLKNSLMLALTMGFFQGAMPAIGYFGTGLISRYIESFSHWIVFIIFAALGIKFIIEAFQAKDDEKVCCIGLKCLITLAIATSIDALAAGISLNLSGTKILIPVLIIGAASFFMSLFGFWIGNCFKKFPSKYLEIAGGLILCALAVKALL